MAKPKVSLIHPGFSKRSPSTLKANQSKISNGTLKKSSSSDISSVPSTLNSKPTPGGREFSEKAVAPDWDKNPVLTVSASNSFDAILDDTRLPTELQIEITRNFDSVLHIIKAKAIWRKHILSDIRYILKYIILKSNFQNLKETNKVFYDRIIQFSNDETLSRKELYNLCLFMQMLKAHNLDNIPIYYSVLREKFTKLGNIERAQKVIEIFYEPKTTNKSPICLYFISMIISIFATWKRDYITKFWKGYAKSDNIFAKIRDYFSNNFYHPPYQDEDSISQLNDLNTNSAHKGYPFFASNSIQEATTFSNELSELEIANSTKKLRQNFNIWCIPEPAREMLFPNFDYTKLNTQKNITVEQILTKITELYR